MDAHDLYHKIADLWSEHVNKHSGIVNQPDSTIRVCVWTDQGYCEVKDVKFNNDLKIIELELDE